MDGLKLPIDPRTLEASVSSRRLRSIELDGTLTHEEPKSSSTALTEQLSRIWEEYPDGILDLTEAKLEGLDLEADAVEPKEEQEEVEEEHDRSKLMTYNDMQKLRDVLFDQLNTARNELWYALELAKTLGVSSNYTIDAPPAHGQPQHKRPRINPTETAVESKSEPPILPAGSYTATPSSVPIKTQQTRILDAELSLAAKHQALDDCTALIDSAVEELEVMAEAGGRFWRDVRQLKNGQGGKGRWAVVPRPDFARIMTEGEKARDVVIPYAVDEAPVQLRTRCLAAFDLDPAKAEPLTFGTRTHRRLRVTIRANGTTVQSSLPSSQEMGIREAMENAQLEALDEELYNEIQNDISRHPSGEVTPKLAVLKMGGRDLMFDLCDLRESLSESGSSATCDLILLTSRLSLLQIHRRRKARLINRTASGLSILQPILQILQYQRTSGLVKPILDQFAGTLCRAGLAAKVEALHSTSDGDGTSAVARLLGEDDCVSEINVTYKLQLEYCDGILVEVRTPGTCRITTSRAAFPVHDLDDLPGIVADDLNTQLLSYAESTLAGALDEVHRGRLFKDDLENIIRIDLDTILELSVPPRFEDISASTTGSIEAVFDGTDLLEWLKGIATRISTS